MQILPVDHGGMGLNEAVAPAVVIAVAFSLVGALVLLMLQDEHPITFGPWAITVIGMAAAALASSRSVLIALHLVQVGVYFGLIDAIDGGQLMPKAGSLVVAWMLAVTVTTLFLPRPRPAQRTPNLTNFPTWTVPVGWALAISHAVVMLTTNAGYSSQLDGGTSAPEGLLSVLSEVAPLWVMATFFAAVVRRRAVLSATLALVVMGLSLTLTGFRGLAAAYGLSVVFGLAVMLPREHPWRSPRMLTVVTSVFVALASAYFMLGSVIRSNAASARGIQVEGARLVGPAELFETVVSRVGLTDFLNVAASSAHTATPESVTWVSQFSALIPRLFFPNKPIVTYGSDVSVTYFGSSSVNSMPLTWLGDLWVNGGAGLVLAVAVFGVVAIVALEHGLARLPSPLGLFVLVLTADAIVALEGPLPLALVNAARGLLGLMAIWVAVRFGQWLRRRAGVSRRTGQWSPHRVDLESLGNSAAVANTSNRRLYRHWAP